MPYCTKLKYEEEVTIHAILSSCAPTSEHFPPFIFPFSSASTYIPFFTSLYLFFLLTHSIHMTNTITQILRYYDIIHSYSNPIHLLARYFNQQLFPTTRVRKCFIPIQQSNTTIVRNIWQKNITHDERHQQIQQNRIGTQKVIEGSISIRIKELRPSTNNKYMNCTFVICNYSFQPKYVLCQT